MSMERIQIGRRGIHDGIIKEIKRQIEDKKVIKVKFMKNFVRNKREFEERLSILINKLGDVRLIKKIGHTVILGKLYKKNTGK